MLSFLTIARGFYQLLILLAELSPLIIKLWNEYQKKNGRLSAAERRRLALSVKTAVKTKNTSSLEVILSGNHAGKGGN